jgi:hypothetical protein
MMKTTLEPTMRKSVAFLLAVLLVLVSGGDVRAETSAVEVRLGCRREATPGRVLCELELEVADGRLAWGDALVVRAPDFARPLRARVGPNNAAARSPRRLRLPLALAATSAGKGELAVRARLVHCRARPSGAALCVPAVRDVVAVVEVGAIEHEAH